MIKMPATKTRKKRDRGKQAETRNQVAELLNLGLTTKEICQRLDINETTFFYHVKELRKRGHIFPGLAARRGPQTQPLETPTEEMAYGWRSIRIQKRNLKLMKFVKDILEAANERGMIDINDFRDPFPSWSPFIVRNPEMGAYEWVTALGTKEMRLIRGLAKELERRRELCSDPEFKTYSDEEIKTVVDTIKTFDLVNLRENARLAAEKMIGRNHMKRPEPTGLAL